MNDCDLSSLICDDQDATITRFRDQKGFISNYIYQGIISTDPMIRLLQSTKKNFPDGMGDTLTRGVLTVTNPNELDGLNWNTVKANYPGHSACCNEYRTFDYGSRVVHGCLSQIGYKSPSFCKTDVILKHQWVDQLMQIIMSMRNISTGVWSNWLKASYQKSVTNVILSKDWNHPENHGSYPSIPRPTTFPTINHFDILNERMKSVGGLIGSPIKGFQTVVMGRNSFIRMKNRQVEIDATLYGFRSAESTMATYNEFTDANLGTVITWHGYAFILIDKPRRFRNKTSSESWDDAIVPSTINMPTEMGVKTERNPDYYNPNIVIGEETLWLNAEAVDWLVPPAALIKSVSVGGKEFFPATNYAGDFEAVHCPLDAKKKTVQFMADFMAGMMSMFPDKGRAIMHLPVLQSACDDDDAVCISGAPVDPTGNYIRQVSINAVAGQLQILVEGTLPEGCPPGYALFIESEKGQRFLIGSIITTWAFAGSPEFPQTGNYYVIALATGLNAAAIVRPLCDPWSRVACLPTATQNGDPNVNPCGVCVNSDVEPDTTCTLTAIFTANKVRAVQKADNSNTVAVTNYTTAGALQTALQTWLTANGGGTATVTGGGVANGFEWMVVITEAPILDGGAVVYDDGIELTNEAPFVQTGTCVAT